MTLAFKSKWLDWRPTKTRTPPTDKTDKNPFVSNVSAQDQHPAQRFARSSTQAARQRVVLLEVPKGVPADWVQGVARLLASPRPTLWSEDRWALLREDAWAFIRQWAAEAARLGWTDRDLFAVHRSAPLARYDCMGLAPLLGGHRIKKLCTDCALLETPNGARQTYQRRGEADWPPPSEWALLWETVDGVEDVFRRSY